MLSTCEWQLYPQGSLGAILIGPCAQTRFWVCEIGANQVWKVLRPAPYEIRRRTFLKVYPWTCRSRGLLAQLANLQTTFFLLFLFKKMPGEGASMRQSKITLPFSLTCSVDFFMFSPYRPYNKPASLALIPLSFTSLNPFVTFFRPLQPHSSSHNWGTVSYTHLTLPTKRIV